MAVSLKIDFDNLYEIGNISEDLRFSSFNTKLDNGRAVPLPRIATEFWLPQPAFPHVYLVIKTKEQADLFMKLLKEA